MFYREEDLCVLIDFMIFQMVGNRAAIEGATQDLRPGAECGRKVQGAIAGSGAPNIERDSILRLSVGEFEHDIADMQIAYF